jgi:PAS domain-containing protein
VKWENVPLSEIAKQFDRSNGRIQQMRGFLTLLRDTAATVKDRTGRILWANRAAEVLFESPLSEFRGKMIEHVLGPAEHRKAKKQLEKVLASEAAQFEYHRSHSYAVVRFMFVDDDGDALIVSLRVKM